MTTFKYVPTADKVITVVAVLDDGREFEYYGSFDDVRDAERALPKSLASYVDLTHWYKMEHA